LDGDVNGRSFPKSRKAGPSAEISSPRLQLHHVMGRGFLDAGGAYTDLKRAFARSCSRFAGPEINPYRIEYRR
jgi:hypothetical protein